MGRITKSPTVGTIEVGRREMIEQIESFPPASDHIPNDGKKVVGGDGEVTAGADGQPSESHERAYLRRHGNQK